jgi:hypothetical protein
MKRCFNCKRPKLDSQLVEGVTNKGETVEICFDQAECEQLTMNLVKQEAMSYLVGLATSIAELEDEMETILNNFDIAEEEFMEFVSSRANSVLSTSGMLDEDGEES